MEYNVWGQFFNLFEYEVNLVFIWMLFGLMDYIFGIFSLKGCGGQVIFSMFVWQFVLYVVIYSLIQMVVDLFEYYEQYCEVFCFIEDVVVDWDDSCVLNGEVGDYVILVCKDCYSCDWYLGSIIDEYGCVLLVLLGFLELDVCYCVEIYCDGECVDYCSNLFVFECEICEVISVDMLSIVFVLGGGQVICFMLL